MELVDVHCHLESSYLYKNLDTVLRDAVDTGVKKLITSSITPEQWPVSLGLATRYEEVECALGVHPWYLDESFFSSLDLLGDEARKGAVAIGEIGLDIKVDFPALDQQVPFFEKQLAVARELNLPVIMHCRGAWQEILKSIKRVGMPEAGGLLHSFSGSPEIAEDFIPLGISFSMGGILTYRNSRKRKNLLKKIYPRHFLLETDSPDIPPVEVRTDPASPNVPANIIYNLRAAADILEKSAEEIARETTANAVRIFNLDMKRQG